jgi:hypothetical protein
VGQIFHTEVCQERDKLFAYLILGLHINRKPAVQVRKIVPSLHVMTLELTSILAFGCDIFLAIHICLQVQTERVQVQFVWKATNCISVGLIQSWQ